MRKEWPGFICSVCGPDNWAGRGLHTAGIYGVQKQVSRVYLTKGPKACWERCSRKSHYTCLACVILRLNFAFCFVIYSSKLCFVNCSSCQRCPTVRPFKRPALPSHASLSYRSEEFLLWTTSPTTGTPSGLSVLTPQTSSSPPTPKQVLRLLLPDAALFICSKSNLSSE